MDVTTTPVAESSPAAEPQAPQSAEIIEIPRDAAARQEWRLTGKLPSKTPKPASAPGQDSSENHAPASEAGHDPTQERKRSNAETRLTELLADLKQAGLSPAELKTYKKQAQAAAAEQPASKEATEQTEKPAATEPKLPEYSKAKPKLEDFNSLEEWTDALTDWKAEKRDFDHAVRDQQERQRTELTTKLESARSRYGKETDAVIQATSRSIFQDAAIPGAVKALVNDSDHIVDLLYTLGSKEGELERFIALAKSKPGAAIREAVLTERLIADELAKSAKAESKSDDDATDTEGEPVERAADGRFKPARKVTLAPPPPREASGRQAAPRDAVETAAKTGDFRSFRSAANARDVARFHGK